jgi:alkanesulfonate monooxygenase SsuD/methylene tetrahydromethanopterin reductase-like flavin-dependent oxidoreductase (luciferase family)
VRIGLINELHGRPDGDSIASNWESISDRAGRAEAAGFDSFVFEDALMYRGEEHTHGVWESFAIAAALAAVTETIHIGQSVVNSPYRSPAMTASIVTTLDDISGGRYIFGIGAGNTPDSDYEAFGFPTDRRYSRFAEAIQIIHGLLKVGEIDFEGEFYSATNAELVLRGPHPQGPPINIAAGGPRMLELAARYGDEWNWWVYDESLEASKGRLGPILAGLESALSEHGRESSSFALSTFTRSSPRGCRSMRQGSGSRSPDQSVRSPSTSSVWGRWALKKSGVTCSRATPRPSRR